MHWEDLGINNPCTISHFVSHTLRKVPHCAIHRSTGYIAPRCRKAASTDWTCMPQKSLLKAIVFWKLEILQEDTTCRSGKWFISKYKNSNIYISTPKHFTWKSTLTSGNSSSTWTSLPFSATKNLIITKPTLSSWMRSQLGLYKTDHTSCHRRRPAAGVWNWPKLAVNQSASGSIIRKPGSVPVWTRFKLLNQPIIYFYIYIIRIENDNPTLLLVLTFIKTNHMKRQVLT